MYTQKSETQSFYADAPRKGPLPHRKTVIALCAVVVLLMTVGITLFSIEKTFSDKYEQAVQLMDSRNFLKAKQEFLNFSGYRDSAARAQECQDNIDFDSAEALLKSGDYTEARKIFAALGDFGGAPEKLNECDYAAAMALMSSGKPEEARDAFLALGIYSDSEKQFRQCQNELDYITASEQFTNGEYELAYTAFNYMKGFKDSEYQASVCKQYLDYADAEQLLKNGNFYAAYTAFIKLGSFSDSASCAAACVRKHPKTGELYRNDAYIEFNDISRLIIKAPKSGYPVFVKIYRAKWLVSTVFIASGKNATLYLPWPFKSSYIIKAATGKNWFGPDDAFGDENAHYRIISDNYKMKNHRSYTITLSFDKEKANTEVRRSTF